MRILQIQGRFVCITCFSRYAIVLFYHENVCNDETSFQNKHSIHVAFDENATDLIIFEK